MILGLIKGLIVGMIVSIPVGPLGLLCLPRTLTHGRRAGLAVGLGGTASDTLYSALALFALSFINSFIARYEPWILLCGGLVILIAGTNMLISSRRPPKTVHAPDVRSYAKGSLQGFLISVTNPGTLVVMLILFTFISADTVNPEIMAIEWVGTALGSATSWCLITWGVSTFRNRITTRQLGIMTLVCSLAIIIIGLVTLAKGLFQLCHVLS